MSGGSAAAAGPASGAATVQEFKIRVPKNVKRRHHVMRFNATLNVDFAKWQHVKMERENNMKEYRGLDEDMPKFGAGSEYGRDAREEARRKKFGIVARKYRADDQPWILKVGGKTGKKFKGTREGGVSENAAYYVFTHAADGAIEAYPLHEWYNFQPIQRYKSLSAEEAEQEFGRRNKVMNFFSLMMRKRLRPDDADLDNDDEDKKGKAPKSKELKISDMDELMESGESSSGSEAEREDSDTAQAEKKKKKAEAAAAAAKKKKRNVSDEAFEDSDDGDEEGRERDYISDSSDSEPEAPADKQLRGVAEEDALRKLLTSDEGSSDEEEEKAPGEEEERDEERDEAPPADERAARLSKKRRRDTPAAAGSTATAGKGAAPDSSSELSSDSDTEGEAPATTAAPAAAPPALGVGPAPVVGAPESHKRARLELAAGEGGVSEEAVRRYLARKPMTTTELLTKFKSRKSGVSSERLVETMTQILKRINPHKQTIKGKMYLSIKQ